jgi:CYTH domain-containing protein
MKPDDLRALVDALFELVQALAKQQDELSLRVRVLEERAHGHRASGIQ